MRRGILFSFMTCTLALAPACGDDANSDGSAGTDTSTDTGTGDTLTSPETGEAEGDGDGDPAEGDGDGDGDPDSGDGDGDEGDGDGDEGDGDGDSGDGDGDSGDGDGDSGDGDGDSGDGDGDSGDGDGDSGDGDGDGDPLECGTLQATVRDFQIAHPDFQYVIGNDLGIVQPDLGVDDKPVYAGNPNTPTTTGAANFNQWYNDVDGVNQTFNVPIELLEIQPGLYEYSNNMFFPIDDLGWGNEGNNHNFHFTLEMHTNFLYEGGEVFSFEGDDDLWVFVNGKLGINLGGVHGPQAGSINMDMQAGSLGIEIGEVYALDFFFAERHTTQSNFKITTTIACFEPQ
jgi:fibro-slime domain-containing protein